MGGVEWAVLAWLGCLFQQHDSKFALLLMREDYTDWETLLSPGPGDYYTESCVWGQQDEYLC